MQIFLRKLFVVSFVHEINTKRERERVKGKCQKTGNRKDKKIKMPPKNLLKIINFNFIENYVNYCAEKVSGMRSQKGLFPLFMSR